MSPSLPHPEPIPQYKSGDPHLAFVDEEAEQPPDFDDPYEERLYLKHRLALVFRVFAHFGLSEGVAGHVTMRDLIDPESFWVNPFGECLQSPFLFVCKLNSPKADAEPGMHFSLIRDEDLIRVDHQGKAVEGGKTRRLNYAAYAIHAEIHKARPDVLYAAIAAALGNKKAALLGNHSIMTAGRTIEATAAWFVLLEKCYQIQLLANASSAVSGKPLITIGDNEARITWETVGTMAMDISKGSRYSKSPSVNLENRLCLVEDCRHYQPTHFI